MPLPSLPLFPDTPDDTAPVIRITASVTNASGDGFYRFANTSFALLDPPTQDFYESYNAIKWTISLLTATQEFISTIAAVTEENPFLTTVSYMSAITQFFSLAMSLHILSLL